MQTNSPSDVACISVSIPKAPFFPASSNDLVLFSGANDLAPLCAIYFTESCSAPDLI